MKSDLPQKPSAGGLARSRFGAGTPALQAPSWFKAAANARMYTVKCVVS